jgi:hypothetical protein
MYQPFNLRLERWWMVPIYRPGYSTTNEGIWGSCWSGKINVSGRHTYNDGDHASG